MAQKGNLQGKNQNQKKITTTAGFEPARAEPKRFLIFRLNHSAKLPLIKKIIFPGVLNRLGESGDLPIKGGISHLFRVIITLEIILNGKRPNQA